MVPSSRTPLRPDRLRALNLPSRVDVTIDTWGRPTWVVQQETDERSPTAEKRDSGTEPGSRAERESPSPDGLGDGSDGDRRVGLKRGGGPSGLGGREEGDRRADGQDGGGPSGGDGRQVEVIVEEWRIDDEWWRTPIHRRYVEVVLTGGAHVVLFEDLATGEWFLQQP